MTDTIREYYYYLKKFGFLNGIKFIVLENKKSGVVKLKLKGFKDHLRLRADTSDAPTFKQIYLRGDYDLDFKIEPKFIIDAGAYVGFSSVYFANRYPDAKIIALEPSKLNFSMLQQNIKEYNNITAYNKGLWSKKAFLTVVDKGYGEWGFLVEEVPDAEKADVEALSIGDILKESRFDSIDILKLDIEGSEVEVFSSDFEPWLGKVKMLIIELHDNLRPESSKIFYDAIAKFDFTPYSSGENIVLINNAKI